MADQFVLGVSSCLGCIFQAFFIWQIGWPAVQLIVLTACPRQQSSSFDVLHYVRMFLSAGALPASVPSESQETGVIIKKKLS